MSIREPIEATDHNGQIQVISAPYQSYVSLEILAQSHTIEVDEDMLIMGTTVYQVTGWNAQRSVLEVTCWQHFDA